MNRRDLLRAVGAGTGVGLAGCASDPGDGGDSADSPDTTDTTTGEPGTVRETAAFQYDVTGAVPAWYEAGRPGRVVVVDSTERLRATLSPGELPEERRESVRAFLKDVDYATDRLLYVRSGGPDTCHDRVSVSELRVTGRRLTGRVRAVDTSEPNEACGAALTFPSALVRVTFDGPPVDRAALRVRDGFGDEAEVTASAADSLAPAAEDLAGVVRPETEGEPVPTPSCEDPAFERHAAGFDEEGLVWGDATAGGESLFGLRIGRATYERGERLRVRLTTLSETREYTGNRHKYNLQALTEAGWQEVRGTTDDRFVGYTDEAVAHRPGEGFEWTLELTADGVVDGHVHEDRLTVCPGLPVGRYRFVYWGVPDASGVAVGFDLTE